MSGFFWIEILTILLSLALALICVWRGKWKPSHRYLVLACFAAASYETAQLGYQASPHPAHKLFWVRLGFQASFLLIPVLINLPSAVLASAHPPRAMQFLAWGGAVMLFPLADTDAMFYNDPATGLVGHIGPLFMLCVPLFVLGASHFLGTLYRALGRVHDEESENRIRWVLLGSAGFALSVLPDVLRRTGLIDIFGHPVAAVGVMFFMACTAYAVLRHRLMDVEVAISRGLVYTALFPLLAGIYLATGECVEQVTQQLINSNSWTGAIVAAFVVSLMFEPLKRTLERRVDYYFIRDDGIIETLRDLERAPALFVAEDLTELKRMHSELAVLIQHLEARKAGKPPAPGDAATPEAPAAPRLEGAERG